MTDTAPTATAPTQTAPTHTAPTQTAPTAIAPTHTAPTDTAPTETAPTERASTGTALGDAAGSSVETSAVTMYSTTWCGFCARLKRGLQSADIAFDEVNIEEVDGAADLVMAHNGGNRTVPTLVFVDGSALTNPSLADVKEHLARTA